MPAVQAVPYAARKGRPVASVEATLNVPLYVVEVNLTQRELDELDEIRGIIGTGDNETVIKYLIAEYRARVVAW